jgi:hypothetical protein
MLVEGAICSKCDLILPFNPDSEIGSQKTRKMPAPAFSGQASGADKLASALRALRPHRRAQQAGAILSAGEDFTFLIKPDTYAVT